MGGEDELGFFDSVYRVFLLRPARSLAMPIQSIWSVIPNSPATAKAMPSWPLPPSTTIRVGECLFFDAPPQSALQHLFHHRIVVWALDGFDLICLKLPLSASPR